jgi:hypothetical protein
MSFDEDAETVPLSRFGFRPRERFLYEYDFTDGWQVEVRVEKVIDEAPSEDTLIPMCMAGLEPGPPDGSGGPRIYAERRLVSGTKAQELWERNGRFLAHAGRLGGRWITAMSRDGRPVTLQSTAAGLLTGWRPFSEKGGKGIINPKIRASVHL